MKNQEMIASTGRQLFFADVWTRSYEILAGLPGDTERVRLVLETDSGHRLMVVPMEPADAPFLETVINGVANLAAAKSSAAAVKKTMDGLT